MTSDGNFDCAVESGISNLVWLHISFACTGFRTRSEYPVGVFSCWKIAENLQYIADFQQYSQNFKLSSLSHLSSDLGDSKGKVVRFFEGNALVSSDSGLGVPV